MKGIMRDLADMHGVSEAVLWGMKVDHRGCNRYERGYSAGGLVLRAFSGGFCIRWILIKCICRGVCDVRPWAVFEFVTKPVRGILHFAGKLRA